MEMADAVSIRDSIGLNEKYLYKGPVRFHDNDIIMQWEMQPSPLGLFPNF